MLVRVVASVVAAGVMATAGAAQADRVAGCPERASFAGPAESENAAPSWAPDGRSLAFESTRSGASHIYVLDVRTCAARRVTAVEGFSPDWSPDGRRLVFSRFATTGSALWTVGVDGRGLRRLTRPDRASDMFPAWSRRASLIAFDRADDRREEVELREIWLVRPDGAGLRRLVRGGWNLTPAWSRDGRWLAWASSRGGKVRIWRIRPDGRGAGAVTPGFPNGDGDPSWSPDGRRIAYSGSTSTAGLTVWVKPVAGGRPRNVVGLANASQPAWSPDGRWIAFAKHEGDLTHLFLVRPDGTGLRPIALASRRR